MPYVQLTFAILAEITATTALRSSEGFTRLWPSLVVVVGYGLAFYLLALTLKHLPMGLVYAVWSGVGIVGIAILGWLIHGERVDAWGVVGFAFIITGVVVLNTLSHMEVH